MTAGRLYAAVDLGASSGRVALGGIQGGAAALEIVHRFPNRAVERAGGLYWEIEEIHAEILIGLAKAAARAAETGAVVAGIGIDSWAVDYGLHDGDGRLVSLPRSYRDARGPAHVPSVHAKVDPAELYALTGVQFLPFNTVYQLAAEPGLEGVQALLIPDLLAFRLTGVRRTEATNASTTGLLDARTGGFSAPLMEQLGLPPGLFPPLIQPGEAYGGITAKTARATGLPAGTPVVAVGSHDTASAVAAVPALRGSGFAYISSGTWSLVGLELDAPLLTGASRAANFTNERGVDGTIRYLRNTGGLWLLQECLRQWREDGRAADAEETGGLDGLLRRAAAVPAGGPLIDVDDPVFLPPGDMPGRIRTAATAAGGDPGPAPETVVRCILESLAAAYASTLSAALRLTGRRVDTVHVVGGGSQNPLLCRLTARATGLPVLAGPVEATALGNILVQARAGGEVSGDLQDLRELVSNSQEAVRFSPGQVS